jgi:hypothetical protein
MQLERLDMLWRGNELTYCLNVHPGETLAEVLAAVEGPAREVKARVCPEAPFGLGLRLSARAASELDDVCKVNEFRARLRACGMYTFTVNGFPYGNFHGAPVKDRVYLPDWTSPDRLGYTQSLARVMTALAPPGSRATISTLPLGYRPHGDTEARLAACAEVLTRQVIGLWRLTQESGVHVALALEPEPHCLLETTDDVVTFFEHYLYSAATLAEIALACSVSRSTARELLQAHLGICLDTCHAAVEFEDPTTLLARLKEAEVGVMKVQVSSGLRIRRADDAVCEQLRAFDEPVYLHQVVTRAPDNTLTRYADLSLALDDPAAREREWRVHFHVPVHETHLGLFDSTQFFIAEILDRQRTHPFCDHWEIETYTWDVLPVKPTSLVHSIALEFAWVQSQW